MEAHHQESIEKFLSIYKPDTTILAILLGGSIAHGFATPESDIDVTIIVAETEYQKRKLENKLAFSLWDICTYPGGYIDCKVVNIDFLQKVGEKGSDPARYAYKDNVILFSRIEKLDEILNDITKFPTHEKVTRRDRFAAQLLAWRWYYSEGLKKENSYLIYLSLQKLVLFSCRMILNENEILYPYHKWLLRVTEQAKDKPEQFDETVKQVMVSHHKELVDQFCDQVLEFYEIDEKSLDWPNHFLTDSELNWMEQEPPIDDL